MTRDIRRVRMGPLIGVSAWLAFFVSVPTDAADAVRVVKTPDGGIQPQAAVDDRGTVHLLYYKGEPAAGTLYYTRSADGGLTFEPALEVNDEGSPAMAAGNIRGAHLALGLDGRAHVAWMGATARSVEGLGERHHPMYYTRLNNAGDGFEPPRDLMTSTSGLDGGGSIAAEGAGRVYVAWHGRSAGAPEGEEHRALFVARSVDGGATFEPERAADPDPSGACGCCGMRAWADASGVYLLYRTAGRGLERDMRLVWSRDGSDYRSVTLDRWEIGACPMSSASIAAEGDRLVLGIENQQRVRLVLADRARPERFSVVEPDVSPVLRKHPAVAVNARGESLLAWTEGMAWGLAGRVEYRVFGVDGGPLIASTEGSRVEAPSWSLLSAVTLPDGTFVLFH